MDDRTTCLPWPDKNFGLAQTIVLLEIYRRIRKYPTVSIPNTEIPPIGGVPLISLFLGRLLPRPLLDFSERDLGTRLTRHNHTAKLCTQAKPYLVYLLELVNQQRTCIKPHGIADIIYSIKNT